jgi:hypothetical protein
MDGVDGGPLASDAQRVPEGCTSVLLTYGEQTSLKLALALSKRLPRVLPACVFQLWAPEVNPPGERTREHQATCICVTPEAVEVPGLFYAAGAACPLTPNSIAVPVVVDLEPEDLGDTPLSVFQATRADRPGLLALAMTLNEIATAPSTAQELLELFDRQWDACDDDLRSIPGTLQKQVNVTVATGSFLQTFPYSCGDGDGLLADTLIHTLDVLAEPGSPVAFPRIDYSATRLFDVQHERWIATPKLLSRIRSTHVAFVDSSAIEVLSDSPWLMAATIRARAGAGRSVARDAVSGNFYLAP